MIDAVFIDGALQTHGALRGDGGGHPYQNRNIMLWTDRYTSQQYLHYISKGLSKLG